MGKAQDAVKAILDESPYLNNDLKNAHSKVDKWAIIEFVINRPQYQDLDVSDQEEVIRLLGGMMPQAKAAKIVARLLTLADRVDEKGHTAIADQLTKVIAQLAEQEEIPSYEKEIDRDGPKFFSELKNLRIKRIEILPNNDIEIVAYNYWDPEQPEQLFKLNSIEEIIDHR